MYQVYAVDFITGRNRNFIPVDSFETLKEAIGDFSSTAWEDMENVVQQAVIVRSSERVEAVGLYIPSDKSALPLLVWHYADATIEERYYEVEYARFN